MKELDDLLEQMVEHLKFYRELGVERTASLDKLPDLTRLRLTRVLGPKPVVPSALTVTPGPELPMKKELPKAAPVPVAAPKPAPVATPEKSADMLFAVEPGPVDIFASLPKNDSLRAIEDYMGNCQRCKLCFGRKHIVFGMGNSQAHLMLIGEAPGADEDQQGLPFVGRAGQLLTKILAAIDLTRDDVYITNVVKCRPPENRKPEKDEVGSCEPFLWRQLNVIKPKLICALGATAVQALLKTTESISSLRGRFIDFHGYKLIATFHPAYLLRNPNDKGLVWQDMKKVRDYLRSV
jgi:DNA polymerase